MKTKIYILIGVLFLTFFVRKSFAQDYTWIDLDGTNDYLSFGQDNILAGKSQFTIDMRVHFDSPSGDFTIFGQRTSDANRTIVLQVGSNTLSLLFDGFNFGTCPFVPDINTFYHFTIVYYGLESSNEDKVQVYINGVRQNLIFFGTIPSSTLVTVPAGNLVLGCEDNEGATLQFMDGQFGEFVVWDYRLSEYEIVNRVLNEVSGAEPNILEYFKFNDGVQESDNTSINSFVGGKSICTISPINLAMIGTSSNFINLPGGVFPPCLASIAEINSPANNSDVCYNELFPEAEIPVFGTGLWSVIIGTGIIDNNSSYIPYISNLSTGINILRWTVTSGACQNYTDLTVNYNFFSVSAGVNQTICDNQIQLLGDNPTPGFGNWSTISGYGEFDDPAVYDTWVRNIANGFNIFEWNVTKNGCNNSAQVTITNSLPSPPVIYTLDFSETCDGTVSLNAEFVNFGTGEWSTTGSGIISGSSPYSIYSLDEGINIVRWTVTNGACQDFAEITVINNQVISNAGIDQNVCDSYAILSASPVSIGATGSWTNLGGSGVINNPMSNTTLVTNLDNGMNVFEWTVSKGICFTSSQVTITSNPLSVTAYVGDNLIICNDSTTLTGNDPMPFTGLWIIETGSGTITNLNQFNSDYTNIGLGINNLIWEITDGICYSRDTLEINYVNLPVVNAGIDDTFWSDVEPSPVFGYQLNATPVFFPFVGTWSSNNANDIFENLNMPNTYATNLYSGNHNFTWTVSAGECYASDDVNIIARMDIVNSGNKGIWENSTSWIPQLIPTEFDSVTITNGSMDLIGTTGFAYKLAVKNSGNLTIKGDASKGDGILTIGDLFVYQDIDKKDKSVSIVNVNSGGRVNVEQTIDKSSKGGNGSVYINSGGRVNVEQGIDKFGGSPAFSVSSQIIVAQTNITLTDPSAIFYIGDNGEVEISDINAKNGDKLIIQNGGSFIINQNSESLNPALLISGGGNIIIENNAKNKAGTSSILSISGGRVNVEQTIDKSVNGSVQVNSGGRVNVEQDIDKLGMVSEISVPQLNITDGNVIIGNTDGANFATCTLYCGYISIIQDEVNETGEPNFMIASGGVLDLTEISELGNTSFIEVGDSASLTFLYDAEIITDNPEIIVIEIEDGGSVIDSTENGNVITGTIVVNQNFNIGNQLFSSPVTGIISDNFLEGTIFEWIENQNQWNSIVSGTELSTLKGYKVNNSTQSTETFTGELNSGVMTINLSNSNLPFQNISGWNLIGNPFTSALDWELITLSGIENSLYKFNPESQNYSIYQQGGVVLNGGDQLISMSEGFFVKLNPTNSSAIFSLGEGKVHNVPGLLMLKEADNKATTETLMLTLTDGIISDQTLIGLENGTSTTFESNKDVFKLFAEIPQIYSVGSNSENLAINIFDLQIDEVKIVPLNISTSEYGLFTINADLQISNNLIDVFLHDLISDEYINLRTISDYDFNFSSGESAERFELVFDYTIINLFENADNKNVVIYSNNNTFFINTYENIDYKVQIYSLLGSKVYEKNLYGKNIYSLINTNAEGIYIVKVSTKNGVTVKNVYVK